METIQYTGLLTESYIEPSPDGSESEANGVMITDKTGFLAEETERQGEICRRAEERAEQNRVLILKAQAGDEAALERLVIDNRGLVRSMALRFLDGRNEAEDLIQIGTIGMIRAIRSFDMSRGTAFSTYAVPLIVGEIRRHLRDDGIIRVSRGYRKLGIQLMRARTHLLEEKGREPTVSELARLCDVTPEEAAVALDAISPVASLSDPIGNEESLTYEGVLADPEASEEIERINDRVALAQVLSVLPPLWRQIVLFRYERNLTQQQTANVLGLSQVKISREEKKIMTFLRRQLTGEDSPEESCS